MLNPIYRFFVLIISTLTCLNVFATKPCSKDSFASNFNRTPEEWVKTSSWAAKVLVSNIVHIYKPYPNCTHSDESKCSQQDVGSFEAKLLKVMKGEIKKEGFKLKQAYCSRDIPTKEGVYIFFGLRDKAYDGYYKLEE